MSQEIKTRIIQTIQEYPGRTYHLAKVLASLKDVSYEDFDKYIPELLAEGLITLTIDEEDYVRYSC